MEIKAVIELLKELGMLAIPAAKEQDDLIGKRVLVRTYSAGVHIGTLVKRDGMECRLTNAVRLWKWEGGGLSVSAVATNGIQGGRLNRTPQVDLTNGIEYIPVTEAAWSSYERFIED
ncbi:hypothetical protein UFOVP398_57 [uncultured Caudovirales phage]|uniref:DUF6948 domain-containing protein n=1 Tax=uncultured Caudovirales phage TaxID=2100421 RepID=A0A6J5MA76_9CAUD|nr:hypothetical protein UFOVP398_57 [uncultured Caudovirales phage]